MLSAQKFYKIQPPNSKKHLTGATEMGRSAKYKTADDLLDNTVVRNDCLVWPDSACLMPSLGPASPMAKTFGTTSVIRILFTIVRYPPGGRRLVRF